jgi:hypothetical protein
MSKAAEKDVHRQHPRNDEHMVTSSRYYRERADIERGLKKRDMPSTDEPVEGKKDPSGEASGTSGQ